MKQCLQIKHIVLLLLGLGLLLPALSCKSATSPDGEFEARIIVYNNCGAAVDVYLDDILQFTVAEGGSDIIESLTEEEHKLDAYLTGTTTLVLSESFDATVEGDYEWTISGQATIVVTNQYGKTLYIYESGSYLGYLADDESVTISDVPFGSYYFEATTTEGSTTIVASASIEVTAIIEYSWTIH